MSTMTSTAHGSTMNPDRGRPMPREIAPGVWWIGDCLEQHFKGKIYHGYNAAFMVVGSKASILIDTGHPKDFPVVERHMRTILEKSPGSPLTHIFLTHQETPHSGGLGRVLAYYPDVTVCGDMSDYHMAFPQYAHLMKFMKEGDDIDLGDRKFVLAEPVIRDLRTSYWGFDSKTRTLFPGDGFAYSHYHWDGHCGMIAEEAQTLDLPDVCAVFQERALFWTTFVDMERYVERLEWLMDKLNVQIIAPSHGLPVTDVPRTYPAIRKGLLAGQGQFDAVKQAAAQFATAKK